MTITSGLLACLLVATAYLFIAYGPEPDERPPFYRGEHRR